MTFGPSFCFSMDLDSMRNASVQFLGRLSSPKKSDIAYEKFRSWSDRPAFCPSCHSESKLSFQQFFDKERLAHTSPAINGYEFRPV